MRRKQKKEYKKVPFLSASSRSIMAKGNCPNPEEKKRE
jgi:hypothetical protein